MLFRSWRLGREIQDPPELRPPPGWILAVVGGGIGLLAGLTGTGGGVFLTTVLLLCRWCTTRQSGAVVSLFILLNSLAALAGIALSRPSALMASLQPQLFLWLALVVPAGALGARLGSRRWPVARVRRCLAVVLLLAAIKMLSAT